MAHRSLLDIKQTALLTTALLSITACSKDPEPPPPLAGEGEACQVAADCQAELTCRSEICIPLNAPDMNMADMGDSDMPVANNTTPNNNTNVTPEDYVVSYLVQIGSGDEKGRRFLYAVDTSTQEKVRVSDTSTHCEAGCWLSNDLSYFVYIRPSSQGVNAFDVYATSVTDLKANGDGTVIVSSAERVLFKGDVVSFLRDDGQGKTAYYLELGATEEIPIGELTVKGEARDTQDSWQIDTTANKAAIFSPTLNSLSIRIADAGTSITEADQIYLIDGSNYQEVGGSYFGTNIPTAFSPDGRYFAMLTTAPNNYNLCEGHSDCDAARGQHCGEDDICTAREVTVLTFDLEALDELPNGQQEGTTCTGDDECSPAHECYIPSNIQLDLARCVPRRVVLGLPNTPKQPRVGNVPAREGCEVSQEFSSGLDYTNTRPPITFGADNNVYVVGSRECTNRPGELNIGDSDILRISPVGGAVDVITGNPGEDFDDGRCYDLTEMEIDISDCIVYIEQALLSPGGRELAFLATNPNVTDVAKASSSLDVWSVLSNGEGREWLGNTDLFDEVKRISVHSK